MLNNIEMRFKLPLVLHRGINCLLDFKIRCFHIYAEGLQQQETLDSLPKAIRSSISHFLFYSLVYKVYLFRGVSNDLLFQLVGIIHTRFSFSTVPLFYIVIAFGIMIPVLIFLQVSEMKVEYFPPKEDVILQNEAPTDFYILFTGAVVNFDSPNMQIVTFLYYSTLI